MKHPLRTGGMTLVEVLVALAIVAVSLAAGVQATSALTRNTIRQQQVMLAQLCADNALVALQLSRQMPSVGTSTSNCEQAGQSFEMQLKVMPTPNPNFRRLEARALQDSQPVLQVSALVGRN